MKEELRRRRKTSSTRRFLVFGALAAGIVLAAAGIWYYANLDSLLRDDYARGESLVEQGKYEEAVSVFRGIHEHHPRFSLSSKSLLQAGDVLNLYLGRHAEALGAYLQVEKDYPGSAPSRRAQRQVAEICKVRLKDYEQAIVAYQKLIDAGGGELDRLRYEVADCYFRLENFEQARIEFENLALNHPESPLLLEVAYRIAVAWSLEGKLQEAEKGFRDVSERWPATSHGIEARFGLASVLEEREELASSLKILKELRGVYPNGEALERKIGQVSERIRKKRAA